jgi:hypothetical protein
MLPSLIATIVCQDDACEVGRRIDTIHLAGLCRARHRQVWISVLAIAQRRAAASLPANNEFFRLCKALQMKSVFSLAARRTGVAGLAPRLGTAPVS